MNGWTHEQTIDRLEQENRDLRKALEEVKTIFQSSNYSDSVWYKKILGILGHKS